MAGLKVTLQVKVQDTNSSISGTDPQPSKSMKLRAGMFWSSLPASWGLTASILIVVMRVCYNHGPRTKAAHIILLNL